MVSVLLQMQLNIKKMIKNFKDSLLQSFQVRKASLLL